MKYNDCYWHELPTEAKTAAAQLGYGQQLWDSEKLSSCCDKLWDDLSKEQQRAATVLGYDQKIWDEIKNNPNKRFHIRFSILCFLLGSIFYLKLSLLNLRWLTYMRSHVPESLLEEDDDEVWSQWAATNKNGAEILETREDYYDQYEFFNILATFTFVVMGLCEVRKERSRSNFMLVIAGLAGMAGALSSSDQIAEYWSCISVHLYLFTCYRSNLFFAGCVLECVISYLSLAGYTGPWATSGDMAACFLWLFCALAEVRGEFDFGFAYWKARCTTHWEAIIEIMYAFVNVSTLKKKRQ